MSLYGLLFIIKSKCIQQTRTIFQEAYINKMDFKKRIRASSCVLSS
ncbi:unnamed protein product [Callosobruchus maculatus]|uniref:Uncharacterized protein n=1 Tax=Callosobruchus maculatus TaxID=64391 RepID=A0A653CQW7_CALMS|nr:unnamed protein product [Callosobruchus maculatus]